MSKRQDSHVISIGSKKKLNYRNLSKKKSQEELHDRTKKRRSKDCETIKILTSILK